MEPSPSVDRPAAADLLPGVHAVHFYDDDSSLCDTVARYLGAGLVSGEGIIVIATPDHEKMFRERFSENSVDVDLACERGQLQFFDADETLGRFMVDGMPDPARFEETVAPVIERARRRPGGLVRAYGEMVDVLCARRNHSAAVRLEELWNEITARQQLSLLCGYLVDHIEAADSKELRAICLSHAQVLPGMPVAVTEDADPTK
jgi:hypothetical protein